MSSLNLMQIIGRLGESPNLKYVPSGAAVCTFSVATSEEWKDKEGNKHSSTEWHRCVVWNKLGEICNQYLDKGRQVFVSGKIKTRSWEDENGVKRSVVEVIADSVIFLGDSKAEKKEVDKEYKPEVDQKYTGDDIPF